MKNRSYCFVLLMIISLFLVSCSQQALVPSVTNTGKSSTDLVAEHSTTTTAPGTTPTATPTLYLNQISAKVQTPIAVELPGEVDLSGFDHPDDFIGLQYKNSGDNWKILSAGCMDEDCNYGILAVIVNGIEMLWFEEIIRATEVNWHTILDVSELPDFPRSDVLVLLSCKVAGQSNPWIVSIAEAERPIPDHLNNVNIPGYYSHIKRAWIVNLASQQIEDFSTDSVTCEVYGTTE